MSICFSIKLDLELGHNQRALIHTQWLSNSNDHTTTTTTMIIIKTRLALLVCISIPRHQHFNGLNVWISFIFNLSNSILDTGLFCNRKCFPKYLYNRQLLNRKINFKILISSNTEMVNQAFWLWKGWSKKMGWDTSPIWVHILL